MITEKGMKMNEIQRIKIGLVIALCVCAIILVLTTFQAVQIYHLQKETEDLEHQCADLRLTIYGLGLSKYPSLGGTTSKDLLQEKTQ